MERKMISVADFIARPTEVWNQQWMLLSAGDFTAGKFNGMTVSWGSFGTMWGKPFAMCVVRPQRFTREFLEKYDTFSLCVFPEKCRSVLDRLGKLSGRNIDKIKDSGFTAQAAGRIAAPVYAEAELAVECRKIYFQDFDPKGFLADYIAPCYKGDYHRMYFGEIVAVTGTNAYRVRRPLEELL
jgi:flavin reductase (DIM6/NTAB) family NADH-FMN oxidoreductase RutF